MWPEKPTMFIIWLFKKSFAVLSMFTESASHVLASAGSAPNAWLPPQPFPEGGPHAPVSQMAQVG